MARRKKETNDNKKEKLHLVMQSINKSGGNIKFASESDAKEVILFGINEIDKTTSGLRAGNIHVLWGDISCGKTAAALTLIAHNQRLGKVCALIDLEHVYDKERAEFFGVNTEELVLIDQTETAEEAMEITRTLAKEGVVDIIVIDSLHGMSPHMEQYKTKAKTQDRQIVEDEIAMLAKKMGKFIRATKDFIFKSKVTLLLIGQARTNIGGYGQSLCLTGGKATAHYSILTLFVRRSAKSEWPTKKVKEYYFEKGKERYRTVDVEAGFNTVFKINKHKITGCAQENTEFNVPFYYETGFKTEETDTELDESGN